MKTRRQRITRMKQSCRARATGIFPLGFGGQAIRFALVCRKPLTEFYRLIPIQPHRRIIVRAASTRMLGPELAKLPLRHLRGRHEERLQDRHTMRWLLIPICIVELRRMFLHLVVGPCC